MPLESAPDRGLPLLFDHLLERFGRAAQRLGQSTHELVIAEQAVRVHFAGSQLNCLLRPLLHLVRGAEDHPASDSPLEIFAWESATSGLLPELPTWCARPVEHPAEVHRLNSPDYAILFDANHRLFVMYHRQTRRAVYWIPRAEDLPYWETAGPFRNIIHWWAGSFGGQLTHAAAVGQGGRGALLVGKSGSGKSTTALLSVEAGLEYVGDDYVLLTGGDDPTAHSVYSTAKMHTAFLQQAVPHWRERVAAEIGPDAKALFYLHETCPGQIRRSLRIESILQPRVTPQPAAHLEPQRQLAALLAAAPSTMYQLHDTPQATLSFLANFARQVPAYTLLLGQDLLSGPRQIAELLTDERTRRAA